MRPTITLSFILTTSLLLTACGGSHAEKNHSTESETVAATLVIEAAPAPAPTTSDIASDISVAQESRDSNIQSGTLTAGDYDDHLNPHLYNDYISTIHQQQDNDLPTLDLNQRITIKVTDQNNQPYYDAKIKLTTNNETILQTKTPITGEAHLYPQHDALPQDFQITVNGRDNQSTTQKYFGKDGSADEKINIKLETKTIPPTQLDLLLTIDTTGSMGDELHYLKTELHSIVKKVSHSNPHLSIKVGLIVYRDKGDEYVTRSYPFTSEKELLKKLEAQSYDGGGDYPEAMDKALDLALTLNWRAKSQKIILLLADAPPHDKDINKTWLLANKSRQQQIHIVPIAASGVADKAEYLMRSMAALTQSRYIFLTDDSGVGNTHAEPTIDCYIVTHLNTLIPRVINSLITGVRHEPTAQEIIRKVGNYQNGICL